MGQKVKPKKGKTYFCYFNESFKGIATFDKGFFVDEFTIIDGKKIESKKEIKPNKWVELKQVNIPPEKINL